MKLYCEHHDGNHEFTAGEVERIVYALGGMWTDEMATERITSFETSWLCPIILLSSSRDSEEYAEYVGEMYEARLRSRLASMTVVPKAKRIDERVSASSSVSSGDAK